MEFLTSNQAFVELFPLFLVNFAVFMVGYAVGRYSDSQRAIARRMKVQAFGDPRVGKRVQEGLLQPHKFDSEFCTVSCTIAKNQNPWIESEGPRT